MAARAAAQKISMWRQAWHEVPDLLLSSGLYFIGTGVSIAGTVYLVKKGDAVYQHRHHYTVARPDAVNPKNDPSIYN